MTASHPSMPLAGALSLVVALAPGAIGALALAGWYWPAPLLTHWGLGDTIKPISAVCFVALSLALVAAGRGAAALAALLGYLVGLVAIASLLQDAGFIHLGVDVWLMPAAPRPGAPWTDTSPAPVTSVALLLAAAVSALRPLRTRLWIADFIAAGVSVIGLVALLGHVFSVDQFYTFNPFSGVSLPTAAALLLFAMAALSTAEAGEARRSFSLRDLIVATVVFTAVPLLVLSLNVLGRMVDAERQAARTGLMQSARTLSTTIDGSVSDYLAIGHVLAQSPSLRAGDLAAFREEAIRALEYIPGSTLHLSDADGQFLMSTARLPGSPLPARRQMEPHNRALASGGAQVTGVFFGGLSQSLVTAIDIPVRRQGIGTHVISITMLPERFQRALESQKYPQDWLVALLDGQHRFVARLPLPEAGMGSLASPGWRAAIAERPQGFVENLSIEGDPILTAYVPTSHGWTVGIGVKKAALNEPAIATFWRTAAFGAALTATSILLGWFASRRIARPAAMLNAAAVALSENRPIAKARTGVAEFDAVTHAFAGAAEELRSRDAALRRLTDRLAESEERLRLATESAGAGWFDYEVETGDGVWASSNFRMLGYSPHPEGIATLDMWRSRLHPQDAARVLAARDAALRNRTGYNVEYRVIRADDGRTAWLHANGRFVYDEAGAPVRFVGVLLDISDRKNAEEAVRASEERLRLASEAAGFGSYDFDPIADRSVWSPQLARLVGAPEEAGAETARVLKYAHPDDRDRVAAEMDALAQGNGGESYELEFRIVRPDGEVRWVLDRGRVWIAEREGKLRAVRITGTVLDITERKRTEAAAALLAAVVTTSTDAIVSKTIDGVVMSWNAAAERLFGYSAEEMIGQAFVRVFPPERRDEEDSILARLRAGDSIRPYETIRVAKNGVRLPVSVSVSPIRDASGRVVAASTIARDISEQKRVEAALRESQERLSAALRAGDTGTFHWDIRTNALDWDAALDRLFGLRPDETVRSLDTFVACVHPDDRAGVIDRCRRSAEQGDDFEMEFRVAWPDGSVHWLYDRGKMEFGEDGRPASMTGACVDITKRKLAEDQALRAFDEVEAIYASAPVGLCVVSPEGRLVRINERLAEINGRPAAEHIGRTIGEIVPNLAEQTQNLLEKVVDTGEPLLDVEISGETPAKPGVRRTWLQQWSPAKDQYGRVVAVNVVVEEITARKEAEEALARSNALLRAVTDTTPGLIYVKDREGRMALANPATLAAIGKPWDEVRGKTELEFHFDAQQAEHIMANDRHVIESGEVQSAEEEFSTSDGVHTFFSVKSPLRDVNGEIVGLVGVSSDITERKQAEEHLGFVLRELSHRTKNLFAIVLAIANQTARQVKSFDEFSTRFAARVHALARAHDLLVHSDWTGAPLAEVVRSQVAPFTDRIEVAGPPIALRPEAVQNLSLALHELATNATKYGALSNERGHVRVHWRPIESGRDAKGYEFEWRETGGPPVSSPQRRGFGSTVLSRIAESSFGAPVKLEFDPDGVSWTLRIPPQHLVGPERRA